MSNAKLVQAYYFIASISESQIDLTRYWGTTYGSHEPACGCALGHLAKSGLFGMELDHYNRPYNPETGDTYACAAMEPLGLDYAEAVDLFKARPAPWVEDKSREHASTDSDKTVWLRRCATLMKEKGIDYSLPRALQLIGLDYLSDVKLEEEPATV